MATKKKAAKKAEAKPAEQASDKPLLDEAEALAAGGKAAEAVSLLIRHIRKM